MSEFIIKDAETQQRVLHGPFDIQTHKETFRNYLEIVIAEDGTIMYATPSHQEKVIRIACEKLQITRSELEKRCPKEYYFNYMAWLCKVSGCVALWDKRMEGFANQKQQDSIQKLMEAGLYTGVIYRKLLEK